MAHITTVTRRTHFLVLEGLDPSPAPVGSCVSYISYRGGIGVGVEEVGCGKGGGGARPAIHWNKKGLILVPLLSEAPRLAPLFGEA